MKLRTKDNWKTGWLSCYCIQYICLTIILTGCLFLSITRPGYAADESDTVYKLDDVVISATKMDTEVSKSPTNITIVNRDEIEKYSPGAQDITDLLEQIPGLTVWGMGYGSPSIGFFGSRGNEPSMWGVKLMVNGIDWNAGNGAFNPKKVPINDIERIEIIKTPSAIYGDQASGGVINIVTRVSDKPLDAKVGVGYGSYSAEKYFAVLNGSEEKVQYLIDAEYNKADGYQYNAWEDTVRIYTRLSYLITNQSSLTFHGSTTNGTGNYPYSLTLAEFNEDPRQSPPGKGDLDYEHRTAALVYSNDFGNLKADAKITVIDGDDEYFYNRMNISDEMTLWPEIALTWEEQFGDVKSKLNLGVEYRNFERDLIRQNYDENDPGDIITDSHREDDAWGAYLQNELQFTDALTLNYGIRFDSFDSDCTDTIDTANNFSVSDSAWSPKIGASYQFSDAFNLFAGYNSGFRSFIRGMSASAVTADLKPEKLHSYEIGLRGSPAGFFKYSIALFQVDTTDKIIRVNENPDYENAGKTRARGIEMGLNVDHQSGVYGSINYTYQDTEYVEYREGDNVYNGNSLPRVPEHLLGISLGYRNDLLGNLRLYTNYSSEKFLDSANLVEWEDYWIFNAKYTKRFISWKPQLEFFISGENLGDKQYIEYGFGGVAGGVQWEALYPSRGRTIMAGLNLYF